MKIVCMILQWWTQVIIIHVSKSTPKTHPNSQSRFQVTVLCQHMLTSITSVRQDGGRVVLQDVGGGGGEQVDRNFVLFNQFVCEAKIVFKIKIY